MLVVKVMDLFISHREKRLLFSIEKTTKQPIEAMPIPSISEINETRLSRFKQSVAEATQDDSIESLMPIVEMIKEENEASPEVLMAALLKIAQGDEPLILKELIALISTASLRVIAATETS